MRARSDVDSAATPGGRIAAVEADSPAEQAGLEPDQSIIAVDGAPIQDIIDWQWYSSEDAITLTVATPDGSVHDAHLERDVGEAWGVTFAEALFDGVRTCLNRCTFCFMTQLPPGLRRSLYLRDDDFRLSFLSGNFVTLTNLDDEDVARIIEQRLSPLFVSLHAVDPRVRQRLVCPREVDSTLARVDELLAAHIALHVQIVLVPGVNDGEHLDETLAWLEQRDQIASVGIVPLGFTRFQESFSKSFGTPEAARAVIEQVAPFQERARNKRLDTWVQLADEFYLNAGVALPPAEEYDDYPQYENGIGMVRSYIDEWTAILDEAHAADLESLAPETPLIAVTGSLFAPTLTRLLERLPAASRPSVIPVENRFFGGNVSVTGLLAGEDIVGALRGVDPEATVLLPDTVFNADGLTLDDMDLAQIGNAAGLSMRLVGCDAATLAGAVGISPPDTRT